MTELPQLSGRAAAEIAAAAERLARLLGNWVADERFVATLRSARQEWARAVWSVAQAEGASTIAADQLQQGIALAQRPVFVCGLARSGTTLLRDLLDGHPELVALPDESGFFAVVEPALARRSPWHHLEFLGSRWLEQLAGRYPYWLLGPNAAPYVAFARDYAAWWQVPERHGEARTTGWPLAAFAVAYARALEAGTLPARARLWVEKTPGHYRHLAQIWQAFPAAKVIQIVRRPEAVLASVKASATRRPPHRLGRRHAAAHILRPMAHAYRVAARGHGERFHVIRYEDLVADPVREMGRIAEFLGIAPVPSLLEPTIAGRPPFDNSSFDGPRPDPASLLDLFERALLALAVARQAAKLGYAPGERSSAAEHRVVGRAAQRERADTAAADRIPTHV